MNNKRQIYLVVVTFVMLVILVSASLYERYNYFIKTPINVLAETAGSCNDIVLTHLIDSAQAVSPITVSGNLYFAGERVPIEDPDVRERLERELQLNVYWHSNTLMNMKNANRYFGEISAILKEQGVPDDFKYLALIESGLCNETSPAGAVGFWQLLKETAKIYGLEVSAEVDERYNIEKSTLAACKYLKQAKEQLGTWSTAAGSYNMGIAGISARARDQKTTNYYDLYLNSETSRYVFRILAAKIVFSHAQELGFKVNQDELYQPFKYTYVEVDSTIGNIADFASNYGLLYKHIKILNPWLRDAKLTNKERKKYQIKILEIN
jgi:hypothetical protein